MISSKHQKYVFVILVVTIVSLASQTVFDVSAQVSGTIIPQWVKHNAKFWSDSQISDSDFVKGIQYMLENGIMSIPPTPGGNLQNSNQIPSWIKNNAGFWANGQIDDTEFVKGMQYLVQAGIIHVSIVQQVNQTDDTSTQDNPIDEQASVAPTSCTIVDDVLPDPNCTPGAIDPRVTQDNIDSTICVPGYTKTVRPPVSVTEPQKLESMKAYGFDDSPSNYEFDHLIPLELGGAPDDMKNLWPEPHSSSFTKDSLENYLHKQVCSGDMKLEDAQKAIATNWYDYWMRVKN